MSAPPAAPDVLRQAGVYELGADSTPDATAAVVERVRDLLDGAPVEERASTRVRMTEALERAGVGDARRLARAACVEDSGISAFPPLTLPQLIDVASRDDDDVVRTQVAATLAEHPRWRSVARLGIIEQRRAWRDSPEDAEAHADAVLGSGEQTGPRPALHRLSDVQPEPVNWLWEPYIPRRKITLLEGDPGIGKTWVSLSIAAINSRGGTWPSGGQAAPGRVLYLSAEDGIADTLRPRLDSADADQDRVFALTGIIRVNPETGEEVEEGGISLADIATIEAALDEVRPSLMIIDPIQAYLGAGVDAHRANEVRPVLARVARWAETYNMAVVIIRHLAKSPAARSIYRGLGSIDFAAAARSVLLAGEEPETGRRAIAQVKSSLGPVGLSLGYELRDGALTWTGACDATPQSLLAAEPVRDRDRETDHSALEDASGWLRHQLTDGSLPAAKVRQAARRDGLAWRTVERAKSDLGIISERDGKEWVWRMTATPPNNSVGGLGGLDNNVTTQGLRNTAKNAANGFVAELAELVVTPAEGTGDVEDAA